MKWIRLFVAAGIILVCLQGTVFAETVEVQISDVPPEAEAVQLLLSGEEAVACVHQGAYWNAQPVSDETEISGLSIHWGEGYATKIPRSVLVFSVEEQEPVQRLFVPKTLQLATCTIHHRYFLLTEGEKIPEGEVSEILGTYVGAPVGETVVRRPEYAGNTYTGGVFHTDEVVNATEGTVVTLEYVRELQAAVPTMTPTPVEPESTPDRLPEEGLPQAVQPSTPSSAVQPESSLSSSSPQSDKTSSVPNRTPQPVPSVESGDAPDPGTGDGHLSAVYWTAVVLAMVILLLLLEVRRRKKKKISVSQKENHNKK